VDNESVSTSSKGLMSQKDYANARGWSKQYVHQLVKKGRIHLVDGQIDPDAADRALGRIRDPSRAAAFRTDGMEGTGATGASAEVDIAARMHGSFAKARTVREHYRALRERLDYEQAAGNLVSKQEVELEQFTLARMMRDRLMQGMHDVAGSMAAHLQVEERIVRDLLIERVTDVFNSIANEIVKFDDHDDREEVVEIDES
jgi:hypothetical protein